VPILVFTGHSVLDLGPMYVTDRLTSSDVRRALSLGPSIDEDVITGDNVVASTTISVFRFADID